MESFSAYYKYITMVSEPTGYARYSKPYLAYDKKDGCHHLDWTKTKNAVKYYIYRASSKDGTYKKIGTTDKHTFTFTDENMVVGKTYYYKVKAVTSSGKKISSSIVKGRKVFPTVDIKTDHSASGNPVLSWPKVEGATSYTVYLNDGNIWGTSRGEKLGNTSKTKFTVSGLTDYDVHGFKVYAYSSVSKKSSQIGITFAGKVSQGVSGLTYEKQPDGMKLAWNPPESLSNGSYLKYTLKIYFGDSRFWYKLGETDSNTPSILIPPTSWAGGTKIRFEISLLDKNQQCISTNKQDFDIPEEFLFTSDDYRNGAW